jgi:hypothetical protein
LTGSEALAGIPAERCINTETGWRNIDGPWPFLHASGGICANSFAVGVNLPCRREIRRLKRRWNWRNQWIAKRQIQATRRLPVGRNGVSRLVPHIRMLIIPWHPAVMKDQFLRLCWEPIR